LKKIKMSEAKGTKHDQKLTVKHSILLLLLLWIIVSRGRGCDVKKLIAAVSF
jgi:hypothetical protein